MAADRNFLISDDGEKDDRPLSAQMRDVLSGFSPAFLSGLSAAPAGLDEALLPRVPELDLSNTPAARTAENTQRAADQAEASARHLRTLTEAMIRSVELSEATRADADAAQKSAKSSSLHAKITGYGSLIVSFAALAVALVTLAVSS